MKLKQILSIIVISLLFARPVLATTNTHSLDLESGSSQSASIADASQTGLDVTTALTLEMWIKPESWPASDNSFLLSKFQTGNSNASYQVRYDTQGGGTKITFTVVDNDATNADELSLTHTLTTSVWTHLALTWNATGKEFKWYVNGSLLSTQTGTNVDVIQNSSAPFVVGARNSALFYDGLIDEVRVWNTVRTLTQINDNKSIELVGNESGLQGYWKFNDSYLDETANNNDLTANNSPTFSTDVPFTGDVAVTRRPGIIIIEE